MKLYFAKIMFYIFLNILFHSTLIKVKLLHHIIFLLRRKIILFKNAFGVANLSNDTLSSSYVLNLNDAVLEIYSVS